MRSSGLTFLFLVISKHEAFVPSFLHPPSHRSFLITTQLPASSSSEKGNNFVGSYSFVEESDFFSSEEEEIEAMGGDPSFLIMDESCSDTIGTSTESKGQDNNDNNLNQSLDTSSTKFEWDGEVDEDAYFD